MQKGYMSSSLELGQERKKIAWRQAFFVCWQRSFDLLFVLGAGMILLLLLPLLAILIYWDSPGPIFYSQERVGYQRRRFRIFKFRTMCLDAEQPGKPIWALPNDTRMTRVGRFLRATHLDELPQVLNILKGEMCVIGPRPERPEFVEQLEKTLPLYRERLSLRPGLTGWAQVMYRYTSTDNEALEKLQYDLFYLAHRSPSLDFFILYKTIGEVFGLRGR